MKALTDKAASIANSYLGNEYDYDFNIEERRKLLRSSLSLLRTNHHLFIYARHWLGVFLVVRDRLEGDSLKMKDFIGYANDIMPLDWPMTLKMGLNTYKNFGREIDYNDKGEAEWPGIAVDYTAKTQFLFKISKGIFSSRDTKRVNASIADDKKRIPFSHMIYFGDGDTDVPCMKIVSMFGGHSIAVYNPASDKKRASALKLKRQGRVAFATPAEYTADSRTFQVVCAIIDKIRADFVLECLAK